MKSSRFYVTLVVLTLLVAWVAAAGCNRKKINSTKPSLQATVRVSLSSSNAEGNLDAVNDALTVSNDGRFVAFTSKATNLVANDSNNQADVFFRDNIGRSLVLVSVSLIGGAANGASGSPSMSGDGQYVAFTSLATNLTADVVPLGKRQVYVRDIINGTTTLISRSTGASSLIASEDCSSPKISNDGIFVVFDSVANNLDGVPAGGDDNDAFLDVYRRRWIDGTLAFPTDLISFSSGAGPLPLGGPKGNNNSQKPVISRDGSYVAYESDATNLVTASQDGGPDLNATTDVFVREIATNRTVRCSVEVPGTPQPGNPLNGPSRSATISQDGRSVAFRSTAGTLSLLAQETLPNIYVRFWWDTLPDVPFTEVLSVHTSGATGGNNCDRPTISGDGTKVAWQSPSPALVNGDSNGVLDIFLRTRTTQSTSRESVQTFGGQLDGQSGVPAYSLDGRYIVFWSQATNGVDDDTNGAADIYMRGPPFK